VEEARKKLLEDRSHLLVVALKECGTHEFDDGPTDRLTNRSTSQPCQPIAIHPIDCSFAIALSSRRSRVTKWGQEQTSTHRNDYLLGGLLVFVVDWLVGLLVGSFICLTTFDCGCVCFCGYSSKRACQAMSQAAAAYTRRHACEVEVKRGRRGGHRHGQPAQLPAPGGMGPSGYLLRFICRRF
jgi:hypothetical protein